MIWVIHFIVVHILLLISINIKNKKFFIVSTFIYSLFTFGQRWMTGEDFPGYLLYYIIGFKGPEFGYFSLQDFFADRNLYFGLLIFLIYFITLFNNYKFISKTTANTTLLIYLYMFVELYFMQMSQIRQFIAVSFFINAYFYFYHKNMIKGVIYILISITFHFSVLLVIPLLFIKFKLSKKFVFYTLLTFVLLPLINIKFFINIIGIDMYSNYIESVYDTGLSIFHYFRYYLILSIAILFVYKLRGSITSKTDQMMIYGMLFYILFYGLSFNYAPVLRISYYFKIFEITFIVYYINNLYLNSYKFIKSLVIAVFLIFYLAIAYIDPYNITRYDFEPLKLYQDKSYMELRWEIEKFYYE
ncbi:hypothetical protein JMA_29350 [Jeotgalibacillus malaysiensis]|uniref:EpsG family protein n=1 Tax=Jeotgalibacillus malaysiensis TaxID=1508404 RepID=A0A0B5AU52_9BACL|nr:EpsG family protein [Jeotgalibacillus malaysiensis]AJD92252.1 hypothetical protein JMA_29350 [Jeotgalibacillus malaysiensis]